MGSYISDNISKNENVTYEAHYHWIIWFKLTSVLSLFIKPFLMTKFDGLVTIIYHIGNGSL